MVKPNWSSRLFTKIISFSWYCVFIFCFPGKTGLIFCTVTRFIAKTRLERVKVHVSCTTGYTSDSVSTSKESHVSCSKVAMETILAKQHQMSNVPICFLCYWRGKKKYFNCPELKRGGRKCASSALHKLIIYLFRFYFFLDKALCDERPSVMS